MLGLARLDTSGSVTTKVLVDLDDRYAHVPKQLEIDEQNRTMVLLEQTPLLSAGDAVPPLPQRPTRECVGRGCCPQRVLYCCSGSGPELHQDAPSINSSS